ncbi:FAD-binding oxidoreductase [Pseudonocardia sp. KRD-184]|uniref:FAD-binding oxidoreductase n=1 Tax=Pseudonocardia oceani TaxID=2792013 RepID=A0ABS6UAA6_9PSEU|nr:FAD-binding oxidoreductase [Pseudonocardia oceani]MBW0088799.1 FAD-binding oxidoreductase [Pseudonocardia oceani]MBW0095211.1 FAD-binding oxidoreductase [Pseudonocardia oceani]MBW0110935.1 FAD-binding oxidoreductase [Pseudonocardia oceani]MBW0121706.1 FAD-binding oxidoreductase [Pseudonocardia oceani]MBW0129171.1 FAD-binding oxidoreductase [Pseudonocardia oceani]
MNAPAPTLSDLVTGPVLEGDDPRVAAEVAGFNTAHTPRPALVVGATCAGDVAVAVRWAAAHGLRVSVQSTGHGLISDLAGTVLVTTRRMSGVVVDPVSRSARVGAGVRWAQVIEAAAPYGLAPLSGSSSAVGVVGYTLGGGLGPLARRYGFAADHVRSVQLVTAAGEVRHVDAIGDPELFWALRGGKGNFGIVTEIEFGLVPVATLYGGGIFFPGAAASDVLHAYRTWVDTLPEETTTSIALLRLPPLPTLPEPLRGQFVVHLRVAHLGSADEGAALLAPMRAVAAPLMDLVAEMPYAAVDSIHMDPTDPMPTWDRGATLRALPAEAVDALLAVAGPDVQVPLIMVELRHLGGAVARPPRVPGAVAGRDAAFSLLALGPMAGPLAETMPAITQAVIDRMAPWAGRGALLNFLGQAGPDRVAALWDDADRARLLAVRRALDPGSVFSPGHALPR